MKLRRWEWQGAALAAMLSLAACGGGGGGGDEPAPAPLPEQPTGPARPPAPSPYPSPSPAPSPAPAPAPAGPDTVAPSTPANLEARATASSQVALSWTASTDNVGVTGYRVERCQGAGCSSYTQVATPTGTSYSDTGLLPGTSYGYRVRARDAAGNLSAPATASATTPASSSGGANATVAGTVSTPYPTLHHITIDWPVTGDANQNGVVTVRYRKQGDGTWRQGLPLRRVPAGSNAGFSWANRHSGSLFDLQPGTTYEIELTLTDPDGGSTTRTVTATTRSVPAPAASATVKQVTPATFASALNNAQPGDILQLAAGTYNAFTVPRSGTAGKPIVIRGTSGAVVNGNIDLFSQHHVYLEGLTVNGRIRFNSSNHVAIIRCTINAQGDGIVSFLRSENAYIADNVVTGRTTWAESSLGVNGNNVGEGILVTGPGHVIMNNRVRGFRDGISFLEQGEAVDQYSIDVLNNDISNAADDGIEADYCFHNCRILRNRITNAFVGISSQPSLGGPTYHVRNVIYNAVLGAFKLNNTSTGDVLLHNTVVKSGDGFGVYAGVPVRHLYTRNNLFIGGPGGNYGGYSTGSGLVASLDTLDTATASLDHDGYGSTTGRFEARIGSARISSLAQMRSSTTEKNAVQVGMDVFAASVAFPSSPMTAYPAPDLRIKAGSTAADAGAVLPNINDGYGGSAPDLGAYEAGSALPVYGPR